VQHAAGGRSIAFEDPSLPRFREVVIDAGLATVGVPVDEDGIRVDALAELAGQSAVVVTPAHQFPLGATLHPHRRAALVELARTTATLVIEDDYDGEFRFDRQPVGALQAMAPDQVAYAGTASKTLAPGLRMSWLVLPERLIEPVRAARIGDQHNSVIEQLTLAELLSAGGYDQHVRRCRTHYRRRRDRLVGLITELGGELAPAGIAAGLHVVVLLGDQAAETEVLLLAARRSLLVASLGNTWMDKSARQRSGGIIVGYAAPPEHAFGPALRMLAEVLSGPVADIR
jgi:GntR family transcriptional regulator/MocR family aminotransferase